MMPQRKSLLVLLFIIGHVSIFLGALMKIQHFDGAPNLFFMGIVISLGFIVLALSEVYTSKQIDAADKIMWTLLLLGFSSISGIVYIANSRKQIV